jgi:hypothetical protein
LGSILVCKNLRTNHNEIMFLILTFVCKINPILFTKNCHQVTPRRICIYLPQILWRRLVINSKKISYLYYGKKSNKKRIVKKMGKHFLYYIWNFIFLKKRLNDGGLLHYAWLWREFVKREIGEREVEKRERNEK